MGRVKKANKSKSSKPKVVSGSDGKKKNTKLRRALDELKPILGIETRYFHDGSIMKMDLSELKKKTRKVNTVGRAAATVVRDPNSRVLSIDLSYYSFADLNKNNKEHACDSLTKSDSLKHVDLSYNNTDPDMGYWAKEILSKKKVTKLDLRYNNIGDAEARIITDMALDVDNPIWSINLEHNNISKNCVYELAEKISYGNKYLVIYLCEGYYSEGNQYGCTAVGGRC